MTDSYHHNKRRIQPDAAPERERYVRRLGKYAKKSDLVSSGFANLPPGIESPTEFCRLLAVHERKNGGVYEHEISLPRPLTRADFPVLGEKLALAMAGSSPVIWGVHCTYSADGKQQPHVHALVYPKKPDGVERDSPARIFGRHNPVVPERGGWKKECGGATRAEVVQRLKHERATGCAVINEFLESRGVPQRVDHRSYAERDAKAEVKRKPGKHLGPYGAIVARQSKSK